MDTPSGAFFEKKEQEPSTELMTIAIPINAENRKDFIRVSVTMA